MKSDVIPSEGAADDAADGAADGAAVGFTVIAPPPVKQRKTITTKENQKVVKIGIKDDILRVQNSMMLLSEC